MRAGKRVHTDRYPTATGRPVNVLSPPTAHSRRSSLPAYLAAVLAFASAAVTLFWTLGGTVGLDTVGGHLEELARARSTVVA